jgi:hypothetical protein
MNHRDEPASGWNLPPGCFDHHLPGSRPEDAAWEHAMAKAAEAWEDLAIAEQEEEDEEHWIVAKAEELLSVWADEKADRGREYDPEDDPTYGHRR